MKTKSFHRFFVLLLILSFTFTLIRTENTYAAGTVNINQTSKTLYAGDKSNELQLELYNAKGTIKWSSSNSKVAKVNSKGLVTAVSKGTATITAKHSGKSYTCKIKVKNPLLNKSKLNFTYMGASQKIKVYGTTAKSFKSSKKSVATVSKKGVVTPVKPGKTTISVLCSNGETYKCTVTVKKLAKGDTIVFGSYVQAVDRDKRSEVTLPIEWEVLDTDGDEILVISKCILDKQRYNLGSFSREVGTLGNDWETSILRSWLNQDFYNTAFNDSEKDKIIEVTLENKSYKLTKESDRNATKDKIFCLSVEEVFSLYRASLWNDDEHYNGYFEKLVAPCARKAYDSIIVRFPPDEPIKSLYSKDTLDIYSRSWWLRTPGLGSETVCVVGKDGLAGYSNYAGCNSNDVGVRPAMWIKIY